MTGDEYFDLANKLKLNIANFSAHKALTVTKLIDRQRADENGVVRTEKEYQQAAKKVLNLYQTRQVTEHNTVARRARIARQFSQFTQNEVRNKLYPNLKWIPSRSATPRELHRHFWNKVWSKNDTFWNQNQPGNLWNCKCDIVETDEPATDNPSFGSSAMVGLEGNPAITGEIFTRKAAYFTNSPKSAIKEIENLTYKDTNSSLKISVIADKYDLSSNIKSSRILIQNYPEMDITIRKHVREDGVKNPELEIDGKLADVKNIKKYDGIPSAFKRTIKQKCSVVVIDLNANFSEQKSLNTDKITGQILFRKSDFESGKISKCYVIFKKIAIKIEKKDVEKSSLKTLINGLTAL